MSDFNKLFERGQSGKREGHWVMCFASYYGNVQKLAQEHCKNEQTIRNYAKTYRLYFDLREWALYFLSGLHPRWLTKEVRQLRHDVDYSNWFVVAERVYHEDEQIRIDFEQALDFLRAGMDTSARVFAAIVGGNDMTRTKAFTSALNGINKVLSYFPYSITKRERRILNKAKAIVEKRR